MVANAALGAVDNRPGHAEATSQLVSHAQVLLVRAQTQVFLLDVLESLQEFLLVLLVQGLLAIANRQWSSFSICFRRRPT
jgi:hypothetical protein